MLGRFARPVVGVVAAVACAGVLTACSGTANSTPQDSGTSTSASGKPQDGAGSHTRQWGETVTLAHAEITVGKPTVFTTSKYAQPVQSGTAWGVKVTIHNTGDKRFNTMNVQFKARTGKTPQQEVFDGKHGYKGLMSVGLLPPGQTATVPVAYVGGDGQKRLVLSETLGDGYYTFTGGGK